MAIEIKETIENKITKSKSSVVSKTFEKIFYKIGYSVASRPFLYIVLTVLISVICGLGLFRLQLESRPERLWLPESSDFVITDKWRYEYFNHTYREEVVLIEAENVLQPELIKHLHRLAKKVAEIEISDANNPNRKLKSIDICNRVPELGTLRESQTFNTLNSWIFSGGGPDMDMSLYFDTETYCELYNSLPSSCVVAGILDMWILTDELVNSLTEEDILRTVNTAKRSARHDFPFDFTRLLGNIKRNSTGHIVGAESALIAWLTEANKTNPIDDEIRAAYTAGEYDMNMYEWEGEFINTVLNYAKENNLTENIFLQTRRSFADMNADSLLGDSNLIIIGNAALFIYVMLMLGKFNAVESRAFLSILGFISIYISIFASFGLSAAIGIIYAPLQSFLPLLMIGIGVDDMFVLIQTWENQQEKTYITGKKKDLKERLAKTLQKSGVAIFVTSLTDFVVFLIGALTTIPTLRSFCLYSAIGIAFLFFTQITFFFAWFTIDQIRLEDNRNGILWFIKHDEWKSKTKKTKPIKRFFQQLSRVTLSNNAKVPILILTLAITGVSIWGVSGLQQHFDPLWHIPISSYLYKFLEKAFKHYPEAGLKGTVLLEGSAAFSELTKVQWLTEQLENSPNIHMVESFYEGFVNYTFEDKDIDISNQNINSSLAEEIFGKFIFSSNGAIFKDNIDVAGEMKCGQSSPNIQAVKIDYTHKQLPIKSDEIKAMEEVKEIVRMANFSGFSAATAHAYMFLESDKIIVRELVQNLALALVVAFLMTSLLIANVTASFFVVLSVMLTMVNVLALMNWWGLYINTATTIHIVLCVGLSVDYSAHIGLHFMKAKGSRNDRAKAALTEIGPAVLNGAISTFLAFSFFLKADSFVFISFFKIFLGVFMFGIYKGLIFLPVILSLFGPRAYESTAAGELEADKLLTQTSIQNCNKFDSKNNNEVISRL